MKRVFIVGNFMFPRCGPTSNYVQYLSFALVKAGYEVHVVSAKNTEYDSINDYKGIIFHEIVKYNNKFGSYYDYYTGLSLKCIRKLKKNNINSDDCVIIYNNRPYSVKHVIRFCKKNKIKVGTAVTELFAREDFKNDRDYAKYRDMIDYYIPQGNFVLPISSYIYDYYSKFNIGQMILPILADVGEFDHISKEYSDIKRFIFPANGKMKDSLNDMLAAINDLLAEYDLNAEFHFCGIDKAEIYRNCNDDVISKIIVHEWMKYDELIDLYKKMDFLLLARKECQMTMANFPSKIPEAMTYGVIPVASIVGDYTKYYLKDNVNSILFYGHDRKEISKAILRAYNLSSKEKDKMSKEAFNMVKTRLDYNNWDATLRGFLEK